MSILIAGVAGLPQTAAAGDAKEAAAPAGINYGFKCEADVSYSWKRVPKPRNPQAGRQPAAESTPAESEEPLEIFYNRASERAAAEKTAHDRLEARLPAEQARALADCRNEHENQGQCVADRIRRVDPTYKTADYLSRRAITDGIKEDCEISFGRCLSAKSGPIVCEEDRPPDVEPAATPAPAAAATATPAAGKEDPKAKKK